jgi:hypothetical protein
MEHDGFYYEFVLGSGGIHLYKSSDLFTWTHINNGQPVLKMDGGIYTQVWNVGVAVDNAGVWHLLVECADMKGAIQGGVGLAYSYTTPNGDNFDFDTNKTASHVIPHGGNPDLKYVEGKGLLSIHGYAATGIWETKASTFDGTTWTLHEDFYIGTPGIHVCDPSLIEMADGRTLLSVSFDQNFIYLANSDLSIEQIYDYLQGGE